MSSQGSSWLCPRHVAWRSWNEGPLPIKLPGWYWDLWGWAGLDSARWQLVVLEAFVCVEPSKSWWWYMLARKHPQGNTEPSPPEEVQGNLLEAHICRVSEILPYQSDRTKQDRLSPLCCCCCLMVTPGVVCRCPRPGTRAPMHCCVIK